MHYTFRSITIILLIATLLAACDRAPAPPIPDNKTQASGMAAGAAAGATIGAFSGVVTAPAGAAIGGIAGGAVGHFLATRDTLFSDLDRDHLQLVRIGEEYMIYLPSDVYFYNNSTHLNESFFPALDNIACI